MNSDPLPPAAPVSGAAAAPPARRSLPLIWVVPLVALLVCGYLVQRELRNRGPVVRIQFPHASGLAPGHTKVVYKGIIVGEVTAVRLLEDESAVEVTAQLDAGAASLARSTARFWMHRPEISLRGFKGLDALLTGPSLWVDTTATTGKPQRVFQGSLAEPKSANEAASRFRLRCAHRRGLAVGTAVAFRGVEVGEVEAIELSPDATGVDVTIAVREPHDRLVRAHTVFWNASGLDVRFSLFRGMQMRDGGVGGLLAGSIAFATPEKDAPAPAADQIFELHDRVKPEWQKWTTAIAIDEAEGEPAPPK